MHRTRLVMFAVDADVASRAVMSAIFGEDFGLEMFESAEQCLSRMKEQTPDVLVLDVTLPGMNGLDLCDCVKRDPAYAHIPVVFVSSDDSLDSRLRGYDVGGDDFILKPFAIDEVRRRVAALRGYIETAAALRWRLESSEHLSALLMSNIDEYEVLLRLMKSLNECEDLDSVGAALLSTLEGLGLDGAVQIRERGYEVTIGQQGRDRPLEVAVINQVRELGRVFDFSRRSVYNFDRLTILVNNMPIDDQANWAYLRDRVIIAAELADAKLHSMIASKSLSKAQKGADDVLAGIRRTVRTLMHRRGAARKSAELKKRELLDDVLVSLTGLGLSDQMESHLQDLIEHHVSAILETMDTGEASTTMLDYLGDRLERMLS